MRYLIVIEFHLFEGCFSDFIGILSMFEFLDDDLMHKILSLIEIKINLFKSESLVGCKV